MNLWTSVGGGQSGRKFCKKISLLGGVAQIIINPRPFSCLADVGLFIRPKFLIISPWTKNLLVSSSSRLKDICSNEIFFIVLDVARLTWSTTCRLLFFTTFAGTSYVKKDFAANLESPTSFTRTFIMKKIELAGRLFAWGEIVGIWVEQIVPHRLDVGMILGI